MPASGVTALKFHWHQKTRVPRQHCLHDGMLLLFWQNTHKWQTDTDTCTDTGTQHMLG